MVSWLAGRLALPRPLALGMLGVLGVRVMVERMVVRGREAKGAENGEEVVVVVVEGLNTGAGKEGGAAEGAGVEMGELTLEEEGEDLTVPLDCVWIRVWVTDWVWF